MTDADGMDHPPIFSGWDAKDGYDPPLSSAWERGETNDYGAVGRINMATKRQILAQEAARHQAKAAAAQRRLAALENIPETDPFEDGTVLVVERRGYTYVILRARSLWYSTGRNNNGGRTPISGVYRIPWSQLVDWLVDGGVTELIEMGEVMNRDRKSVV